LQLAQDEIEMRTHVGTGGPHDSLDRLRTMEARLKSQYPDMPFNVKSEFSARLNSRGYTEDAWNAAVAYLQSTDWFRFRRRHF
jgi:CRISPR/Cas system-associated endonuclease Cas1